MYWKREAFFFYKIFDLCLSSRFVPFEPMATSIHPISNTMHGTIAAKLSERSSHLNPHESKAKTDHILFCIDFLPFSYPWMFGVRIPHGFNVILLSIVKSFKRFDTKIHFGLAAFCDFLLTSNCFYNSHLAPVYGLLNR